MMSKPRIWILAHQHFRSLDQLNQVSIAQHSGNFWIGSLDALHTISKGAWDFMALEFFCFLHPFDLSRLRYRDLAYCCSGMLDQVGYHGALLFLALRICAGMLCLYRDA